MLKSLVTKQVIFHLALICLIAFTLSSHTRNIWPGDTWNTRAIYYIARFSLETLLFLGSYFLLSVVPIKLHIVFKLILAILISLPIFTLSITMLDIVLGHEELSGALNDESRLVHEMFDELGWIFPKHVSFCCLVALVNFRINHQELFNFRFNLNKKRSHEGNSLEITNNDNPLHKAMSQHLRDTILRIQAQEHYIKVDTCLGSELIHYKFGQALIDVKDQLGLQVHRSYWVAKENVLGWTKDGANYKLKLKFGETIPVSRRFEQTVKNEFIEFDGIAT